MDLNLNEKVVVITGGAGGLGVSFAKQFLEEGANVALLDKNEEKGNAIQAELSQTYQNKILFIATDVLNEKNIEKAFTKIETTFSKIDILINNAGIFSSTPIIDIESDSWDRVMEINLKSVFLCSKQATKLMSPNNKGNIINIGSLGGLAGGIFAGADYSASKAGIICLTKSMAKQFGQYGIRVNCINPGPIETEMTESWPKDITNDLKSKILIKRDTLGTSEEVTNVVLFMASEKSSLINGAQISVNGGIHIG